MSETQLQKQIEDLRSELAAQSDRFHTFLSLTRQAFACIEFDHPISTKLPAAQQASFMLAAKLVECNDEFARIYDAGRAEDLIGARFVSLILSADRFILRARRFVNSGYRLVNEDIESPRPDGSKRILNSTVVGEIHDSRLVRIWVSMQDVTLSRLVHQFAGQDEVDLSGMSENLDYAFWLMDWQAFKVIYVGPVYEKVWHQSSQELYDHPMSWLDAVHPDDRQRVQGAFLSQVAKGTYDEKFRLMLPDGSFRLIRDRGFPIPDATGTVSRIVGLAADITQPREALAGLDHFFDHCHEMLVVFNSDGTVRRANTRFCQTTGFSQEELAGMHLIERVHEEDRESTRETVAHLNDGVAAVDVKNRFQCKDGTWKNLEWNVAPVAETGAIYATVRDATGHVIENVPDSISSLFESLTPRELQIMRLIVDGLTNKIIARDLGISQRTVEKHRQRVMNKLEIDNVPDLVRLAIMWGDSANPVA